MDFESKEINTRTTYNTWYVVFLVINACFGSFFFGYTLAVLNPLQDYIQKYVFPTISPDLIYLATSSVPLGAMLGAWASGSIASSIGRKKAMIVIDFVASAGIIIEILENQYLLLLGRFICGFCVGVNSALVPTYISEVAPVKIRGTMGTFNQLFICNGILIAFILGFGVPTTADPARMNYWKWMLGVPLITNTIRTIVLLFIATEDTPKFSTKKEDHDSARKILGKIYGDDAEEQQNLLQKETRIESAHAHPTVRDMFGPKYKKRFIAGAGLAVLQQLAGVNAITFYSNKIFQQQAGNDQNLINIYTFVVGVLSAASAALAGAFISKLGRKTILIVGTASCAAILGGFGTLSILTDDKSPILPYLIFAFIVAFGFSLGPVVWLYIPEVLPDVGVSVAVLLNWAFAVIVAQGFPYLLVGIGTGLSFMVFGLFCLVGVIFIGSAVKETQGKTDSEIVWLFEEKLE